MRLNTAKLTYIPGRRPSDPHAVGDLGDAHAACLPFPTREALQSDSLALVPSVTGVHGHLVAGLLAEMKDVTGSAGFVNCEPTFRYSKCIQQGEVDAPVSWGGKWMTRGWGDMRRRVLVQSYDVGRHSLAIQRRQRSWCAW